MDGRFGGDQVTMNRRVFLGLALLLPVVAAGCALAAIALVGAAVAGTYMYVDGEAKQEYSAGLPVVYEAAKRTARRVGLSRLTRRGPTQWKATLYGYRPSDGIKATIQMDAIGENRTRVGVRYGTFGKYQDEAACRHFHTILSRELGR
jgi:hypothetical protein